MGRPTSSNPRDHIFRLRFTAAERAVIMEGAAAEGVNVSVWMRRRILNQKPTTRGVRPPSSSKATISDAVERAPTSMEPAGFQIAGSARPDPIGIA